MILSLDNINQIVTTERLLQLGVSKEKFFLKCFDMIGPRLKEHFGKDYLFFNLYYVGSDFNLMPIRLESGNNSEASLIAQHLGFAEREVRSKKSKSFTEIILTKSLPGLVLHNSKKQVKIGDVIAQDVSDIQYKSQLSEKLKVKPSAIERIAEVYNDFAKAYRKSFYIHFIRPFVSHQHYNGIFLLFLKRPLSEDEYTELALVWTKILSEPQMIELSRESNRILLDSLNIELSHTWNGYFQSLRNIVQAHIIPAATSGDLERITRVRDHLLATIEPAARVQRFFTYLNKFNETADADKVDEEIIKELGGGAIGIKEIIYKTLNTLHYYFNSVTKSSIEELESIKLASATLQKQPNILAFHNTAAVETILFNLLKNALDHSLPPSKFIGIKIESDKKYASIRITNNGLMQTNWLNFINGKKSSIDNIEFSYGIRTVKRIIAVKFPGIDAQMAVTAKINMRKNITEVTFKIPAP